MLDLAQLLLPTVGLEQAGLAALRIFGTPGLLGAHLHICCGDLLLLIQRGDGHGHVMALVLVRDAPGQASFYSAKLSGILVLWLHPTASCRGRDFIVAKHMIATILLSDQIVAHEFHALLRQAQDALLGFGVGLGHLITNVIKR